MNHEALELLRQQSGLSVDRNGQFLHRGDPIPHQRTREVLQRGLRVREDGRTVVHVGEQWAYVEIEDTAFVARNLRLTDSGGDDGDQTLELILTDSRVVHLDPNQLALGEGDRLYAWIASLNSWVALLRPAQANIAPFLAEDLQSPVGYALVLTNQRYPIESYAP